MVNLDTHVLLYALTGDLREDERALLSSQRWGISASVLWELAALAKRGRIEIDLRSAEFRRLLGQLTIWPVDVRVAATSAELDFEADPADELIAATSVVHRVPLLTRDRKMLASEVVPLAG